MRALAARVVDRREPAARRPTPGAEELERVGHLVHRSHAKDAERVEQGLVGAVLARERAGMGRDQVLCGIGVTHLHRDDGEVELRRAGEGRSEALRVAHGLHEERHGACAVEAQRVREVLVHGRGQFQTGGHDQVEVEPSTVVEHR